jgi:hypothetical protein
MPRWFSGNVPIGQGKRLLCLILRCGAICTEWTFGNCCPPRVAQFYHGEDFSEIIDGGVRNGYAESDEKG